MKILLDENNYITSYVITGDVAGGIDIDCHEDIFNLPCQFYKYENNNIICDVDKYKRFINNNNIEQKIIIIEQEIQKYKNWFTEYDNQVKQYERCVRLGIDFDKDIAELDQQAADYQLKIRELNEQINTLKEERTVL